jgi:acetylornithine deacetylase/succinyl-diaminopimelate desuccinylase-like protein
MGTDYGPDMRSIQRDVEVLAQLRRSTARPGERTSAAWLARRLADLGIQDVSLQPYRYQRSYALAHCAHNAAGLLACRLGGRAGALIAAATLLSYEREVSGRSQWIRRLLPGGEGVNVTARIPAQGERLGTLVLVAHHDAANTGLIWSPRLVSASAERHLRRRRVDPFMAPVELAFSLVVAGALAPRRARLGKIARVLAATIIAIASAIDADVARGETVPGACDNASGVAACLDLARALHEEPLDRLEVLIVLPGAEEAGMGGMAAFLQARAGSLDPARTFVLGLDTIGAGTPIVCSAEGAMREQRYRDADLALVDEGAALAGHPAPERWRIGGWTDPVLAMHRGLPSVSMLSMGPGYFPNYHHPSDLPEHVDWACVEACARIAAGTIAACERRFSGAGG